MDTLLNVHKNHVKNTICLNITSFHNQDDCDHIMKTIKNQYESKTDFYLIIETKDLLVENISLRNLYNFSAFLNSLKQHKYQYLKKTLIKIYNNHCYDLLYILFTYLSSPVAIVEVILYKIQETQSPSLSNIEKIKQYFPKN